MAQVFVELVGGPLDGEVHVMPEGRPELYFVVAPDVTLFERPAWEPATPPRRTLVYRRTGRRCEAFGRRPVCWFDAPTGEPVLRYELVP